MTDFVERIGDYSSLITALATLALAVLSALLWWENRILRKAGSSPDVVAYLAPHPDGHGGILLVFANVGRGPAFDVKFSLDYDEADFRAHNAMLLNDEERMPFSVIPQDEKISTLLGVSFQLYGKIDNKDVGPIKPFSVNLEFTDIHGRQYRKVRKIDIRQFAGLHGVLEKSNARKVSESLDGIERHLRKLARGTDHIAAIVDKTQINDKFVRKAKGDS